MLSTPYRRVDIIVPEATRPCVCRPHGKGFRHLGQPHSKVKVNGHDALQAKKVRLIAAKASDVDISMLFEAKK